MGDAADELWDAALGAQMDFDILKQAIVEACGHPDRACTLVSNDYEDEDEWLPYRCIVCGKRFDY